ncbi:hypothetical protein EV363DRAFT_1321784 [Boletus edulis]|nr:hypothetical protein EV363DRAFT_1321784 [Boletus edulis]
MEISSILQGGYQHPLSRSWQGRRQLTKSMFMYPIFITDDPDASVAIPSLPGQCRWGVNQLEGFLGPLVQKGLRSVILFGVPLKCEKDERGSPADDPTALSDPSSLTSTSLVTCVFASTRHTDTVESSTRTVQSTPHPSVDRMAEVALNYARAGAHCVAPSDMMDGRIRAIKRSLVDAGFGNRCTLMSYSAKFASGLYGPFSWECPAFGDRKCYQLPSDAKGLARRAIQRDVTEGADIIMVKPSLPYLDIIADAAQLAVDHPIACYQVSGEFAMVHAGARAGVMVRAGATLILSYFTPEFLEWLTA